MPKLIPLSNNERTGHDFTHLAVLTANDLTQATANTAQVVNYPLPVDAVIEKSAARLITPFEDPSDAAFNSTTVDVGDTGSATRWFTAKQVNKNGSFIAAEQFAAALGGPYAVAQNFAINFNSMAAKSLVNLKKGELHVFVKLTTPKDLSLAQPATTLTK
jgi:hypothetical protein